MAQNEDDLIQTAIQMSLRDAQPEPDLTYEEMEAISESLGKVNRGFKPSEISMMKFKPY